MESQDEAALSDYRVIRIASILFIIVVLFVILRELSSLLLPLVLALFIVMLLQPLLFFLIKKKFPNWLAVTLVSMVTLLLLFVFGMIVSNTASQLSENGRVFIEKIIQRIELLQMWINSKLGNFIPKIELNKYLNTFIKEMNMNDALGSLAVMLGDFGGKFLLFALYFIILLYGFSGYKEYIIHVGGPKRGKSFLNMFEQVMLSISSYIRVKMVVSLATGFLFWLTCTIFGVEFALFWGFLAFILNFIPSIGSIVATIPPILMGLIYLDSGFSIIVFAILLSTYQIIIGNLIDPILLSGQLELNTLTVIIGLLFWGYIWGVAGMILSVPLLVFMKIVFEQFEETEIIAKIMGKAKPKQKKAKFNLFNFSK
ncbi:MAG: AI-2E family transporter [Candidatus Zixiibacteriota bacterium]